MKDSSMFDIKEISYGESPTKLFAEDTLRDHVCGAYAKFKSNLKSENIIFLTPE